MQITPRIHALRIPFTVPVAPDVNVERQVFVYLIAGASVHLIDSGVAGTAALISDYVRGIGRDPREISTLVFTHAHPDHIGAARSIRELTGCKTVAHALERGWIEDTELQFSSRPVPGFHTLVEGSVPVDQILSGGETLRLEEGIAFSVLQTPGHSSGSVSLIWGEERSLFTGDALIVPGDLPIYEDIAACLNSVKALEDIEADNLFSSWEPPIQGRERIRERMRQTADWLNRIHESVLRQSARQGSTDGMELCRSVVKELALPPAAVNPLVARAFASSLPA